MKLIAQNDSFSDHVNASNCFLLENKESSTGDIFPIPSGLDETNAPSSYLRSSLGSNFTGNTTDISAPIDLYNSVVSSNSVLSHSISKESGTFSFTISAEPWENSLSDNSINEELHSSLQLILDDTSLIP